MPEDEQKKALKEAFKEAARDFMQEKFAEFGRWSFYSIGAAAIVALLYLILHMAGWKMPNQ